MKLSELFEIRYGHSLELNRLTMTTPEKGIRFISRKTGNNGVAAYVEQIPNVSPNPPVELTCALNGNGVLTTFIQDKPYYTAFHVACLKPKVRLSTGQLLYFATCIGANAYKYSWGRQANRTLKDLLIPGVGAIPGWVETLSENTFQGVDAAANPTPPPPLDNVVNWKSFRYDELFRIERGRGPRSKDLDGSGTTPFITSTDRLNGLSGFTSREPCHEGNCITVTRNGSIAEAFYQPVPFCSTEDVHVLLPLFDLNPYRAMFLCTLIRKERYRFGYGRKWGLGRMRQTEIKLPVRGGQPDWSFIEQYVKSLPFSKQIESVEA